VLPADFTLPGDVPTPTIRVSEGVSSFPTSTLMAQLDPRLATYTITFGDRAENHAQILGELAPHGLSRADLWILYQQLGGELYDLRALLPEIALPEASVLVVRGGVARLTDYPALFTALTTCPVDRLAKMRGKVVNKKARWNCCFGDKAQAPNYSAGQGTVVPYSQIAGLELLRANLHSLLAWTSCPSVSLVGELNYYYATTCGMGYHGDGEHRVVSWFRWSKAVGWPLTLHLAGGDLYFMSDQAAGWNWKKSSQYTLRHAAGANKYTSLAPYQ
jgi:hypothetical protein